ncbi:hypothetical protein DFR42_101361 [Undibacterium pigrum]|uniref:Uncharacterized protein n=1 Tax=Undibacterium pigrum TaxID=401470 RepID=A0A318JG78_9BURK|nr:hypothetical protein DFR42_101361 [Undibacterium pigrum]
MNVRPDPLPPHLTRLEVELLSLRVEHPPGWKSMNVRTAPLPLSPLLNPQNICNYFRLGHANYVN